MAGSGRDRLGLCNTFGLVSVRCPAPPEVAQHSAQLIALRETPPNEYEQRRKLSNGLGALYETFHFEIRPISEFEIYAFDKVLSDLQMRLGINVYC